MPCRATIPRATLGESFRYLIKFSDGLLHDPAVLVDAQRRFGLSPRRCGSATMSLLRIIAIDTQINRSLKEAGIDGVFTVEPT